MAPTVYQVQSRGIYHGLPVFPPEIRGLTAVVTGSSGISGQDMVRALAASPERWSKIYCLSRRPPAVLPPQAEFVSLDFLQPPEKIIEALQKHGVDKVDYVFFYSYINLTSDPEKGLWSDAEGMCKINLELLSNFLSALKLGQLLPRRVMLQTGAKAYGVHIGPAPVPQEETDARVLIEPNFYYVQEDYLYSWCAENNVGWNSIRPAAILGAVPDAAMNLCFPLAVYATVCRKLGQPLEYPADLNAWETLQDQSSSLLNGYLAEWAVLSEHTANETFNASDGSAFTWGKFWPRLAEKFGVKWKTPELDDSAYAVTYGSDTKVPRGFGPPLITRQRYTLAQWAKKPEVRQAWRELAEEHGLVDKELRDEDRIFGFADIVLAQVRLGYNMDKVRRMGFFGTVATAECMFEVFEDLVKLKMVPPIEKV
ncbi:NAD dependent epimerase/dehydratase family protein-like protein [Mycena pura]|uniref:NAD dependent epimerase/dehydratase family protein-like protein n=1 Tax=Mycena pura TaxID=153505 RepID=A0AAD6V3M8_9AGAR|nr:NAD dependent epimerase/dehydratase family protein-like protein [Mycena pura]